MLKSWRHDADYLRDGLYLAEHISGNNDTRRGRRYQTDRRNRELTEHRDDKQRHKDIEYKLTVRRAIDYRHNRGDDHKLISQGIKEFTEVGYKSSFSCYLSVQHIGKRRRKEYGRAQKICYPGYRQKQNNDYRRH